MAGMKFGRKVTAAVLACLAAVSLPAYLVYFSEKDSNFMPGFIIGLSLTILYVIHSRWNRSGDDNDSEAAEEEEKDDLTASEEEFRTDRTMYR